MMTAKVVGPREGKAGFLGSIGVRFMIDGEEARGGFSLVEILSPCPTILKMDPLVARQWVGETLMKTFPLGVFRDRKPELPTPPEVPVKTVAQALSVEDG